MKIAFFFILTVASLSHCKQNTTQVQTKQTAQATEAATAQAEQVVPISLANIPKASASKAAYLSTARWHCIAAMRPGDDKFRDAFLLTDLRFSEDGSVRIFNEEAQIASGRWAFDDVNSLIYISSNQPQLNSSWKVIEKGFRMIWMGNTELNKTGVQMRWDCYKD